MKQLPKIKTEIEDPNLPRGYDEKKESAFHRSPA